jgi:hypothetical protein
MGKKGGEKDSKKWGKLARGVKRGVKTIVETIVKSGIVRYVSEQLLLQCEIDTFSTPDPDTFPRPPRRELVPHPAPQFRTISAVPTAFSRGVKGGVKRGVKRGVKTMVGKVVGLRQKVEGGQ